MGSASGAAPTVNAGSASAVDSRPAPDDDDAAVTANAESVSASSGHCGFLDAKSSGISYAVCEGDVAQIAAMLDSRRFDVNEKDDNGQTPLNVAFRSSTVYWAAGYSLPTIALLLDRGANANAPFADGDTPLADAAYFGRVDVVALLVAHGADVNLPNRAGHTPLHQAAVRDFRLSSASGSDAVIDFLASRGAH